METVQLSLTEEQASLLKRLLQAQKLGVARNQPLAAESVRKSLHEANYGSRVDGSTHNMDSLDQFDTTSATSSQYIQAYEPTLSEEDSESDVESMECSSSYTIKDLLCKKKTDTKSTKAQNFLHISNNNNNNNIAT